MKFFAFTAISAASAFVLNQPAGDPTCKNGFRSIVTDPTAVTVCCPKYCGRCNDYETCKKVNGQASDKACCASTVQSLTCENKAEDPYCIKSCDGKSAPCSLGVVKAFEKPADTTASADCGSAAKAYADQAKTTVEAAAKGNNATAISDSIVERFNENVADKNASK